MRCWCHVSPPPHFPLTHQIRIQVEARARLWCGAVEQAHIFLVGCGKRRGRHAEAADAHSALLLLQHLAQKAVVGRHKLGARHAARLEVLHVVVVVIKVHAVLDLLLAAPDGVG